MKLYLSSQGIGERTDNLLDLVGSQRRTAVVANAVDYYDKHDRQTRVRKEKQTLREIGLKPEELDLRDYLDNPNGLQERIALYGLLWIRGGNVFNLRRAMQCSHFDEAALDLIKSGEIVYGGYSAALAVAGPDLFGSEIVDDPYEVPVGYDDVIPPTSALGLLDYYIAPHYMTDMPWGQDVLNYVEYMKENGREVVCLRDGEVHIIDQTNSDAYDTRQTVALQGELHD